MTEVRVGKRLVCDSTGGRPRALWDRRRYIGGEVARESDDKSIEIRRNLPRDLSAVKKKKKRFQERSAAMFLENLRRFLFLFFFLFFLDAPSI